MVLAQQVGVYSPFLAPASFVFSSNKLYRRARASLKHTSLYSFLGGLAGGHPAYFVDGDDIFLDSRPPKIPVVIALLSSSNLELILGFLPVKALSPSFHRVANTLTSNRSL